jgi:hypothetical protein
MYCLLRNDVDSCAVHSLQEFLHWMPPYAVWQSIVQWFTWTEVSSEPDRMASLIPLPNYKAFVNWLTSSRMNWQSWNLWTAFQQDDGEQQWCKEIILHLS